MKINLSQKQKERLLAHESNEKILKELSEFYFDGYSHGSKISTYSANREIDGIVIKSELFGTPNLKNLARMSNTAIIAYLNSLILKWLAGSVKIDVVSYIYKVTIQNRIIPKTRKVSDIKDKLGI